MTDIEKLAKALPKVDYLEHLGNLKQVYSKNSWHGVDLYVNEVLKEAHRQSQMVKMKKTISKWSKFITCIKNKLK